MAKRRGSKRGGGKLDQQIDRLKEEVGPKGVKAANDIVAEYDGAIIKLAFKLVPKGQGVTGLGTRIEAMLANMPKAQALETRERLLAAKMVG